MRPGQSCPGVGSTGAKSSRLTAPCFNEAGAIMPRSGREPGGNPIPAELASMRPGQSCPGVGRASRPDEPVAAPGFNEAGAIMPRSGPECRAIR